MNEFSAQAAAAVPSGDPATDRRPVKRVKVAVACDVCRAKKVKCDGLRPICSPCARRSDRGIPCEYSTETRTSHGPSKGYVHHLESKLRELQGSASSSHFVSSEEPQLFHAINRPPGLESPWSVKPPTPGSGHHRQSSSYSNASGIFDQRSPTTTLAETSHPPSASLTTRNAASDTISSHSPSSSAFYGNGRSKPTGPVPGPSNAARDHTSTAPSPYNSAHAPSTTFPNSGSRNSPIAFEESLPGGEKYISASSVSDGRIFRSEAVDAPSSPGNQAIGVGGTASFAHQIKSTFAARLQSPLSRPPSSRGGSMEAPSTVHIKGLSPQNVDYVLPSRKTADNLIRAYWEKVFQLLPILDREEFEHIYACVWSGSPPESDESLLMCTLNLVFALASQNSDKVDAREREILAAKFFVRAQSLLDVDRLGTGSIHLVQCLLLMSQYLHEANSLHRAWTTVGLATRIAEGLELHLPETTLRLKNRRQREHLRRIWYGCYLMDRIISIQLGRSAIADQPSVITPLPLATDDQFLEAGQPGHPLPLHAFYVHSLRLYNIMRKPAKASGLAEEKTLLEDNQHKTLFFRSWGIADIVSVLEIDQLLLDWDRELPAHLRVHSASERKAGFDRLANIINMRHLHCSILLFRPILLRFCHFRSGVSTSWNFRLDGSLVKQLAIECANRCVNAARELIELIYHTSYLDNGRDTLPSPSQCVFYLYSSATVLQAGRLLAQVDEVGDEYAQDHLFWQAVEVLKNLEHVDTFAQRCVMALEMLAHKIAETTASRDQPRRKASTSAPAGSTLSGPELGQTQPNMPTLAPGSPDTAREKTNGSESSTALPTSNLDLSDMSWLTSVPADLC